MIRRWLTVLLLLLLVVAVAQPCEAMDAPAGPDTVQRVLQPQVAKRLEAAFERAAPSFRLDSARIAADRVQVRVCAGDICHDLVLSDGRACTAPPTGAWCATWQGAAPATADALLSALAADADAEVWHVIAARPRQPPIVVAPPPANQPVPLGAAQPKRDPADGRADTASAAAVALRPVLSGDAAVDPGTDAERAATARLLVIALLVAGAALAALLRLRRPALGAGAQR